jgi:glycosyltransferase involved in cell wall biosynthesis
MKVLVYFNPGEKNDCFQATRLRKNIKGSLELNSISWVESLFALPDIIHLLSPDDEAKAHDAKEDGVKVVVSCGYSEADPFARYFVKDNDGYFALKGKALRLLESADLVFVPSDSFRSLLKKAGVQNPHIIILSPGVNLARFEKSDKIELEVFYRYMRLPEEQKYVLSLGDYDNSEELASLKLIASKVPELQFYFCGMSHFGRVSRETLKSLNHDAPKNLRFLDILEDDVFRSAMMSASAYLSNLNYRSDSLAVLEAFAAKCQVFGLGKPLDETLLIDKKSCYLFDREEKVAKSLQSYCLNKLPPTIMEGYKIAKANALALVGSQLKAYYESALKDSEEFQ